MFVFTPVVVLENKLKLWFQGDLVNEINRYKAKIILIKCS